MPPVIKKSLNYGLTLLAIVMVGQLTYMNLRFSDPILQGWQEYESTQFQELMQKDVPVLVEIYASWCPTCLIQHRSFEKMIEAGEAPDIHAVRVDFDRDEAFRQELNINATGLLLIMQNNQVVAYGAGLTSPTAIKEFLIRHDVMAL